MPEHQQQIVSKEAMVRRIAIAIDIAASSAKTHENYSDSQRAAAAACLFGLALLHNLSQMVHQRHVVSESGVGQLIKKCSGSAMPAEVQDLAQRLQQLLLHEAAKEDEQSFFSHVFVQRGAPGVTVGASATASIGHAVSKRSRRQAQQIAKAVLRRQRGATEGNNDAGHDNENSSLLRQSPVSTSPLLQQSSAQLPPPSEGYGRPNQDGWRVHRTDANWLFNQQQGLYLHLSSQSVFMRDSGGEFVEVSSHPPPRPVLVYIASAHDNALLKLTFAAIAAFRRQRRAQQWSHEETDEGSSSSSSGSGDSEKTSSPRAHDGARRLSSNTSDSSSSDEDNIQQDDEPGQASGSTEHQDSPQDVIAAGASVTRAPLSSVASEAFASLGGLSENQKPVTKRGPSVGAAAADLFRGIEDFVPAQEGRTPMYSHL